MTTLIKHKRVEFSELFYDLVFVFAISKVTTLIDHLHNGIFRAADRTADGDDGMVADTGKKQNIYGLVLSVCFCYDCTVPDGDVYAVQGDRYVKSGKSGGDHLCICRVWSGIIGVYVCRFYQGDTDFSGGSCHD